MQEVKNTTKAGQAIINDYERVQRYGRETIYTAYGRPSTTKVNAYNAISDRANATAGYQHDLSVVGAGSHFFSTIYSIVDEIGRVWLIKDTASNTYKVQMPEVTA